MSGTEVTDCDRYFVRILLADIRRTKRPLAEALEDLDYGQTTIVLRALSEFASGTSRPLQDRQHVAILRAIDGIEASDAHHTAGRSPVFMGIVWDVVQPLVDLGLVRADRSSAPMRETDGRLETSSDGGWLIITEPGRAALQAGKEPEL